LRQEQKRRKDGAPNNFASSAQRLLKQNADGRTGAKAMRLFGHDEETVGESHGGEIS
jgi:hypothetical protein